MNVLIAWRYLIAKKSIQTVQWIAWISMIAMAVGTAALIIVLSVFNGFEDLVKGLYGDFYTDIRVVPKQGKRIALTDSQLAWLGQQKDIQHWSPILEEKAVLIRDEWQTIVQLKGVLPHYTDVSGIGNHIIQGSFELGKPQEPKLVLGWGVENALGADIDAFANGILVAVPQRGATNIDMSSLLSIQASNSGTFLVQQEFDNKYVFTHIDFLHYMFDIPKNEVSAIEIKLVSSSKEKQVVSLLEQQFGSGVVVQTRFQQNQSLYTVMATEKWVIYAILSLILVVAAFNMIGALTMLVLEKRKDIAVLKTLGATADRIQKIFLLEGMLLAFIGAGAGMILATVICLGQMQFKWIKLGGSSFLIDYYPVQLQAQDYLLVAATVFAIALFAAWVPARKAAHENQVLSRSN